MSSRRGTYITDFRDFLDPDDELPPALPTSARNLALHVGAIVAWMTSREVTESEWTNVPCRRSPGRRRCSAEILAEFESTPVFGIRWWCPLCGDNGFVYGWEDSPWDRSVWSQKPPVSN